MSVSEFRIKTAKKFLEKHTKKCTLTFRGVPLSEFNKEELLKIALIMNRLYENRGETIDCLSRI